MMKRGILAILLSAQLAPAADLPVKEVVLYKHGVGYFERSGRLGSGESARLDFDASEMNDVLKSLTITERGGGKISGLRYDSMDPLAKKLEQFPFRLGEDQSLSAILGRLQGARIELKFGSETVAGTVVSGRMTAGNDRQAERQLLTLLVDSGELRTVDLNAATGIRLTDSVLQQQFKDYLATLAMARSKERRGVYIDSTDSREREIVASYMTPSAVWKSSYRLIFGTSGQPTLEGWAIVDNTTGEDWNKVQLSLVSGRPISFVSQLYAPKYVTRPGAELADDAAARPVVHEGAFGNIATGIGGARPAAAPAQAMAKLRDERRFQEAETGASADMLTVSNSSIAAQATARELGDLFEYRIAQPVTIRKNESAMLPFLQQSIQARKLLIYSDHSSRHPTNAAELSNSTGKTLDGGPITVYDGGAYGGEALMETLKQSDKRLISYAVDLGTRITENFGSKEAVVREIHANRGVLTTKVAAEETRTYTVNNVDQKPKTLIIEHPLRPQYNLLNQKPSEKTPTAYRFEVALAAGATQEFAVSEERIFDQTYAVVNLTPDVILTYVRNRSLSEAGRKQLQAISDQKRQAAENDRALADIEKQISEVTNDEDRIRRNISSLNSVSGQQQQVQNYARQIEAKELQMTGLRDKQAEMQKRRTALAAEINRLVEALTF